MSSLKLRSWLHLPESPPAHGSRCRLVRWSVIQHTAEGGPLSVRRSLLRPHAGGDLSSCRTLAPPAMPGLYCFSQDNGWRGCFSRNNHRSLAPARRRRHCLGWWRIRILVQDNTTDDLCGSIVSSLRQMVVFASAQRSLMMATVGTGSRHIMANESVMKILRPLISAM